MNERNILNKLLFQLVLFQLTNTIFEKERMRVRSIDDLKITDKMKSKAADYVKKKMNSYEEYKRSPHR